MWEQIQNGWTTGWSGRLGQAGERRAMVQVQLEAVPGKVRVSLLSRGGR